MKAEILVETTKTFLINQFNTLTTATTNRITYTCTNTPSTNTNTTSATNANNRTATNSTANTMNNTNTTNTAANTTHISSKLHAVYPPVIISLSGGVDSMVIVRILIYLRTSRIIPLSDIIAVHIDYANRAESGKEADFLENYCHRHNLKFEKRVVSEVTRGITDRQEYERVARVIRYSFYEQVCVEI